MGTRPTTAGVDDQGHHALAQDRRQYVLAGIIRCGTCRRRMEGVWNHGRPYYRCQLHRADPTDRTQHPNTIYVREDALLAGLDGWLAELFDPYHLDDTAPRSQSPPNPTPTSSPATKRSVGASLSSTPSSTAIAP